jgi:hypothetical protein
VIVTSWMQQASRTAMGRYREMTKSYYEERNDEYVQRKMESKANERGNG